MYQEERDRNAYEDQRIAALQEMEATPSEAESLAERIKAIDLKYDPENHFHDFELDSGIEIEGMTELKELKHAFRQLDAKYSELAVKEWLLRQAYHQKHRAVSVRATCLLFLLLLLLTMIVLLPSMLLMCRRRPWLLMLIRRRRRLLLSRRLRRIWQTKHSRPTSIRDVDARPIALALSVAAVVSSFLVGGLLERMARLQDARDAQRKHASTLCRGWTMKKIS